MLVTADADVPTALRSVRLPPPACRRDIRRSMKCVALLEALLSSVTPTSLVLVHVQSGSGCGGSKKTLFGPPALQEPRCPQAENRLPEHGM